MSLKWTAAGLTAAMIAMGTGLPATAGVSAETIRLAQADNQDAVAQAQALLQDAGNLGSLSDKEIKNRIRAARRLLQSEGMPEDLKASLEQFVATAQNELQSKGQGQQQQQPAAEQQQQQPAGEAPAQNAGGGDQKSLDQANAILADAGNIATMNDRELSQRMKFAQQLVKRGKLPPDILSGLQSFADAARQELENRQAKAQGQEPQGGQPAAEQPAQNVAPSADQKSLEEANAILADAGNIATMNDRDLTQRMKLAQQLVKRGKLPPDTLSSLQSFADAARQELENRQAKAQGNQPPAQQQTIEQAPALEQQSVPQGVSNDDVAAANKLLSDQRPLSELTVDDLKNRSDAAKQLLRHGKLTDEVRDQLKSLVQTSRQEIIARKSGQPATEQQSQAPVEAAPNPPSSTAENRAVDNPDVSPEAEAKAHKLLAERVALERMSDEDLRTRLERFRDLLEAGNLSRETERDLRKELKDERDILRARVASRDLEQQAPGAGGLQQNQGSNKKWNDGPVEITRLDQHPSRQEMDFVVKDRRPLSQLNVIELNRRILVYRELSQDDRYSDQQLFYINGELDKARKELRRRYENDKLARYSDLDRRRRNNKLNVDINIDLAPGAGRPRPPMIWAAEEDDSEIEQQLVARPLHRLQRRYPRDVIYDQPETVLTRPEIRDSLPGVEIDTINFGFNEAFVREEEVQNLDSIATIIEQIVTAHPQELFVIEGHTDAVGSDAYNLTLSKQRAEAVRKILLEFYNIGPENVVTVGLGERYLKIPTPDPEQENRRVTVRRATPLLTDYNDQEQE